VRRLPTRVQILIFTHFPGFSTCWGFEKSVRVSEHKNTRFNLQFAKDRETKNLQKTALTSKVVNPLTRALAEIALTSKVVNPLTRALAPPFIGRRRDFLHSENTLESREYS
jgi:hypothetical protein